jgi:hypothetical protein
MNKDNDQGPKSVIDEACLERISDAAPAGAGELGKSDSVGGSGIGGGQPSTEITSSPSSIVEITDTRSVRARR